MPKLNMTGLNGAPKAGVVYAIIGVGFVLGAIRVFLVMPLIGEAAAVLLEAPVMLVVSWYASRWCVDRLDVPRTVPARSVMGVVAFVGLMAAESALAVAIFGRSLAEYLASYGSMPGVIGFVAQVFFAVSFSIF